MESHIGGLSTMNTISHSKCNNCNKILPVSELKENQNGIGKICIDSDACKKRKENSNNASTTK
jgi:hypothetical protein